MFDIKTADTIFIDSNNEHKYIDKLRSTDIAFVIGDYNMSEGREVEYLQLGFLLNNDAYAWCYGYTEGRVDKLDPYSNVFVAKSIITLKKFLGVK